MATIIALIGLLFVFAVLGIKVITEHEQGLVTRFGAHYAVLGPGLHMTVPIVDRVRSIDLRDVAVTKRIDPGETGRIRIGNEDWDARSDDPGRITTGTPIRITALEGQVMVVTAG
ncbi:MAG: NfeD family protein [Acidimicrobiia bacterium]|nr:NfeD family protein [Acidimicrobiia bacterium]